MKLKFRPVSFLKPKNINKNQNNQTISPIKYQYNLSSDTISFSGKSLVQQVKDLEKDAFLSDGLREYILSYIDDKNNLIDLHKEYYASLLNCKTLDEAKELYPEFRDVVDLKDVDLSSISFYAPKQIAKGQIEGLNKENASLVFLKKYIGELTPLKSGCNEDYFYLSYQTIKKMFKFLNISMNDDYESLITKNRMSKARKEIWQNEEYRTKTVNSMNVSDFRKQRSKVMLEKWQDEEFRERLVKNMRSQKARDKRFQTISESRQQYIKNQLKQQITLTARKIAYAKCIKEMEDKSEILKNFPHIKKVLSLKKTGFTLKKMAYVNKLFDKLNAEYPRLALETEKLQNQILSDWGFYDENCNLNEIAKKVLNFKFNSTQVL